MAPHALATVGNETMGIIRPTSLTLRKQSFDLGQKVLEELPIKENEEIIEEVDEEEWIEKRKVIQISCDVLAQNDSTDILSLKILLRFEDSMNRQLCNNITKHQTGVELATELVIYGLINEADLSMVALAIQNAISRQELEKKSL